MIRGKIKIVYVVLEMDLGGIQRIVHFLIKRMDQGIYDPYLCCLDRGGLFYEKLDPGIAKKYILKRQPGPFDLRMFKELITILRDNKIDIIHSHNGCSLYAALAGKVAGVKGIIHTDHGRLVPDRKAAIWEDRFSSYLMDRFVGVSNQLTDYLGSVVKVNKKKLTTIINGVDTEKFLPFSDEEKKARRLALGFDTKARIIGTVCRLDPVKNLTLLIESVPAILQKVQDCQVVIVGDGPDEKHLKDKAYRLNLNSKVIFLGRAEEVEKMLSVFDLYVNTSVSEGTSMTILEAMSCGLPVVASAVGGNVALVDNTNGVLFPSGRADLFQETVIKLLVNSDMLEKMGIESRKRVEQRYSFDRVVEQYAHLYSTLLNK